MVALSSMDMLPSCFTILLFVTPLLIQGKSLYAWCRTDGTILLVVSSTVLQGKFINDNGLTLVWRASALSIDVSVVSMSNDLPTG